MLPLTPALRRLLDGYVFCILILLAAQLMQLTPAHAEGEVRYRIGAEFRPVQGGVEVVATTPGAPAEGELEPGDIVKEVSQEPVVSPEQVAEAIQEAGRKGRRSILFLVERENQSFFAALSLDRYEISSADENIEEGPLGGSDDATGSISSNSLTHALQAGIIGTLVEEPFGTEHEVRIGNIRGINVIQYPDLGCFGFITPLPLPMVPDWRAADNDGSFFREQLSGSCPSGIARLLMSPDGEVEVDIQHRAANSSRIMGPMRLASGAIPLLLERAPAYRIGVNLQEHEHGFAVTGFVEGSPAADNKSLRLEVADVITHVDGFKIDFPLLVERIKIAGMAGDSVLLTILGRERGVPETVYIRPEIVLPEEVAAEPETGRREAVQDESGEPSDQARNEVVWEAVALHSMSEPDRCFLSFSPKEFTLVGIMANPQRRMLLVSFAPGVFFGQHRQPHRVILQHQGITTVIGGQNNEREAVVANLRELEEGAFEALLNTLETTKRLAVAVPGLEPARVVATTGLGSVDEFRDCLSELPGEK